MFHTLLQILARFLPFTRHSGGGAFLPGSGDAVPEIVGKFGGGGSKADKAPGGESEVAYERPGAGEK